MSSLRFLPRVGAAFSKCLLIAPGLLGLAGCTSRPIAAEKAARDQIAQVETVLRPRATALAADLPALRADSPLEDYVRFAVLKHPAVSAAYYDWRAAVEAITPARSLRDPQFTFEADIADTLMTFMPGLMFDLMTPGKRDAMGREAAARSGLAYRTYVATVLRTATTVRKTCIELAYAEEIQRLYVASILNIYQSLEIAGAEYTTGRGMPSLEQMVRLRSQLAEHHTHHEVFGERVESLHKRLKSALGLAPGDPDPAWPHAAFTATRLPSEEELWRTALATNPDLGSMRAMVDMAVAEVAVARAARTPDFTVGAMTDLKADPLMVRPTATVTLPIWRDKISANVAAAQARHDAAIARVNAEQLNLAAELAQMLFMVRESDRMIEYLDRTALPNLEHVVASAEAGYQAGMGPPAMISEARHMSLTMKLERAKALLDRELAAADLLVMLAGTPPVGAPLLAASPPPDPR